MSAANHRCLNKNDLCIYYRDKERHVFGSPFTETNSVIANFKKRPSLCKSNPQMASYKEQGIKTIAHDVARLFQRSPQKSFLLIPAVTSKSCDDPDFDDRLIKVCSYVAEALPNVWFADLLYIKSSIPPAHTGGTRDASSLRSNIGVRQGYDLSGYDYVLIFDDVLTTGAHFKACQMALEEVYGIKACGMFWAREESYAQDG